MARRPVRRSRSGTVAARDVSEAVRRSSWSTGPVDVSPDPLDLTVAGDVILLTWDYGVRVPLWDGDGLVPEEPAWLRGALGLSDALTRDLGARGDAMCVLDLDPPRRSSEAYADLDRRARELVARLREELPPRFTVEYRPW